MILIDSNILIDYLNGKESILDRIIDSEDMAICGIILSELLHGVKNENEKKEIVSAINDFKWISIEENIWQKVGDNLRALRKAGVKVPYQDAVIATICIEKNILLATNDRHFEMISKILDGLQLYK